MRFGEIHISDSLWALIERESGSSQCLKVLKRALLSCQSNLTGRSRLINPELFGNYFSFRESEGMISYTPRGKELVVNPDRTWNRRNRQGMKPGKWLRSLLHPKVAEKIADHIYAEFATIVKTEELEGKLTFLSVDPDDGYDSSNFNERPGDEGKIEAVIDSCMWNDPVANFYRAYGAKVLVAKNADDEWVGRAVLWKDVEVLGLSSTENESLGLTGEKNTMTFLDRIYAEGPQIALGMKQHAQSKGWLHKLEQNRDPDTAIVTPDGRTIYPTLKVTTSEDLSDIKFFPYLDTFRYGGHGGRTGDPGVLSNSAAIKTKKAHWKYSGSTGVREDILNEVQVASGEWVPRARVVRINNVLYDRDDEAVVRCDQSGNYFLRSESYRVMIPAYSHSPFIVRSQDVEFLGDE